MGAIFPRVGGSGEAQARAPEFFAWAPLLAVLVFTLNNFWIKGRAPVAIAGKLSDFAACFFLPLFVAALLAFTTRLERRQRVLVGCLVTTVGFSLVKISHAASAVLDSVCASLGSLILLHSPANRVDVTDLVALPMVAVAFWWARNNDGSTR
jgi:hypothetical protein